MSITQPTASRRLGACANCGSTRPIAEALGRAHCPDCEWPVGVPIPDAPFCSVCRRCHGPEQVHACE
jgi:hypothetical protein